MRARLPIMLATLVLGSAPSLAQERIWNLDQTDAEVYLVFGVPETDDVGVSFWCTQQSGIVKIVFPGVGPHAETWRGGRFQAGGRRPNPIPSKARPPSMRNRQEPALKPNSKQPTRCLQPCKTANRFAVKAGSSNHVFPLGEADFPTFLDVCGKP